MQHPLLVPVRFPYPRRNVYSLLKRLLVSQSSRAGADRADRELAYMFKWYNDNIDVRRGIRKPDFMWGRTWSEMKIGKLWVNIDGPSPGGNQHMPAGGAEGVAAAQKASSQVLYKGDVQVLRFSVIWGAVHLAFLQ